MLDMQAMFDIGGGSVLTLENFIDWSVDTGVTSLNPADYQGGSPQIVLTVLREARLRRLIGRSVYIYSAEYGTLYGTVRNVSEQSALTMTITIDHVYALLNSYQEMPPRYGFYYLVMDAYFSKAGVPSPVFYDASAADYFTAYPAWSGNLYDTIKESLAARQYQMRGDVDSIVIEKRSTTLKTIDNHIDLPNWTVDTQTSSEKVRVHFYNNERVDYTEIYPPLRTEADKKLNPDSEDSEPQIYSVDASEVLEVDIPLNISLSSVQQPGVLDYVPRDVKVGFNTPYPNGVYSVVGNDGLPITAAQWIAQGGKVTTSIADEPGVLRLTITGMSNTAYAPYRIAMSSGGGNYYNSMHLVGSGTYTNDDFIDIYTGGQQNLTGQEVGVEVTNRFIDNLGDAMNAGQHTAGTQAMNLTLDSGRFLDFSDGSATFSTVAGSRIRSTNSVYRILSAQFGPGGITYSATEDTLFQDFDSAYAGLTMAQFDALWGSANMLDFSLTPLGVTE